MHTPKRKRIDSQTTTAQDIERLQAISQQLKLTDEHIRKALALLAKGQVKQ
jgi:hypothetical protein